LITNAPGEASMTHPLDITFAVAAGPFDLPLMLVVVGTVLIALTAHVLVAIGWLRRR
jgi:hypothetical protein